jgi:hypothetical protein
MMKEIAFLSYFLFSCSTAGFFLQTAPSQRKNTTLQMSNDSLGKEPIDSYGSYVKGGCIQNLENHIRLLDQSLEKSRGNGMFQWIQTKLLPEDEPVTTIQQLNANARFGVLSHGTQPDPIFNYGNMASLELFEQNIEDLCQTPSRYSTVPELMDDRSDLIQDIEIKGYGCIKNAIRVSAKGNLFLISQILVWTVFDDDDNRIGLAAIYDRNGVTPYEG